jgi:predicted nucleic acid-binding protein
MVIIDTDIIIKSLQNSEEEKKETEELLESQAAVITPIQITEVYSHAEKDDFPAISSFFDLFDIQNFDREVAEMAAEFMQQYKEFYPKLTTSDCLVGALAAINDYEIYTNYPDHFPMTEVQLYHKTIKKITAKSKPRLANQGE